MNGTCKSTEVNQIREQVKLSLYPERLEISKICSILSDDLTFKIEDLNCIAEIQKNLCSKDDVNSILKSLQEEGVLDLNEKGEATYVLPEELTLYSFINASKMGKEEFLKLLGINEKDIKRIYKQSLYWFLVSDNSQLEGLFKTVKIGEENLKYDITSSKMIKKQILKSIQHHNYIKETDDLKASSPNSKNSKFNEKEKFNKSGNTYEHFSWRKKSDMSTNSNENNNSSGKKDPTTSSFKNNSKFPRRERFNSDPHDKNNYPPINKKPLVPVVEEVVKIDPNSVKYSLNIVYKYSNREIIEYFDRIKEELLKQPNAFEERIEEICDTKCKEFKIYEGLKDRAKTFSGGYEFKTFLGQKEEKIFIPKNNPLQIMNTNVNK